MTRREIFNRVTGGGTDEQYLAWACEQAAGYRIVHRVRKIEDQEHFTRWIEANAWPVPAENHERATCAVEG